MSDKEPPNPFEEIQRQLSELFKDSNVKVSTHTFNESDIFDDDTLHDGDETNVDEAVSESDPLEKIRSFHLKPKEVRDYLNRFVIRQDEAKKVLSVAICDHYNHVRQSLSGKKTLAKEYSKQNILLLGPTGVGKTYLIKNIARLIGVPFVKADATKFSETGYVGSDVEDLVRDLVKAADGDIELAEHGIIFVDEIDKIANEGGMGGRDVSGRGVQINLLKLMEETEVNLFSPTDMMAQMQAAMDLQRGKEPQRKSINTRNILFIVSGAFDKLSESIKKRLTKSQMGFGAAQHESAEDLSSYLRFAETTDFTKYGFEPEFIGRVPVRVACRSLSSEDLAHILTTSEGSILNQYIDDFRGYGIDFNISAEAILAIAEKASTEGTGARGLMTVLERLFRDFKFELPSSAIKRFDVTPEMLEDPRHYLKELKEQNAHLQQDVWRADIKRFATNFEKQYGFTLEFKPLAEEVLIKEMLGNERSIQSLCEEKFKDFEHGLSIIHRNSGQTVFKLGKLAIQDPDKELSKWVVRSIESVKKDS
ncbi:MULTISPECIES: AAA family ATPase [unclassified Lentimonas]|uniref:AAA family ATPase n=1 Tax=unclassified Lentimonas TaxID=2630993 RepID=UPI0013258911|nr:MULTISPECIES: AAA family ATPase [unclassified Lentimonas]CAA6679593.1 ATP-dependent Clp protease ATP-binding subunit ClpX [Lentimonas sp. CC4]CAA6687311.1 ATP-dependent Clp protease ATP-binding subunit ClpX [Lentimonas sp. CC6]CAA6696782.1 ATP-dependent Clp protease ATP-binding subunit ClpX [Lentimonas sp. CC19]CAA6697424.1 ATP-dependent Clp protease ATP-binding subunit ClpX [Lentimonas sp. CC10]CAA7071353.1 ATP-dependent Clp protease ATP-binding subunit ClpX [Lentimonas sp. CC11]